MVAPFAGALPPMSDAEWQRLYHLYQQIPQYVLLNDDLGLAGFKRIFWLEWTLSAVGPADRTGLRRAADLVLGERQDRTQAAPASCSVVRPGRTSRSGRLVHGCFGLRA